MRSLLLLAFAVAAWPACAQEFPSRPVKLVLPYVAGGVYDPLIRTTASVLQRQINQPVIVENRPGGELLVGAQAVLQSPADGNTLFAPGASITTWKALRSNPPVDAVRDFAPVILLMETSGVGIYVSNALPVRSLRELVAYAKANPGKLNYGHSAPAMRLTAEWLKEITGMDMVPIAYKGSTEAMAAIMSNDIQLTLDTGNYAGLLNAGKMRMLAFIGKQRSPARPDVPSTAEEGIPELSHSNWLGVLAPRGVPRPVIERLNRALGIAIKSKEFEEMFLKIFPSGSQIVGGTPERFAQLIEDETARWARVAKTANIAPQ